MSDKTYIRTLRKRKIREAKEIEDISSGEACKFVACSVAVQYFEKVVYGKMLQTLDVGFWNARHDVKKRIIDIIKDLEKRCWRKSVHIGTNAIVKLALFLEGFAYPQIQKLLRVKSVRTGIINLMQKMKMIKYHKYERPKNIGTSWGIRRKEGYWDSTLLGRKRYWAAREREEKAEHEKNLRGFFES